MKYIVITLVFVCILPIGAFGEQTAPVTCDVYWGMTFEQVKIEKENATEVLVEILQALGYPEKAGIDKVLYQTIVVFNEPAEILYYFKDDSLISVIYIFEKLDPEITEYIFKSLISIFDDKYIIDKKSSGGESEKKYFNDITNIKLRMYDDEAKIVLEYTESNYHKQERERYHHERKDVIEQFKQKWSQDLSKF